MTERLKAHTHPKTKHMRKLCRVFSTMSCNEARKRGVSLQQTPTELRHQNGFRRLALSPFSMPQTIYPFHASTPQEWFGENPSCSALAYHSATPLKV